MLKIRTVLSAISGVTICLFLAGPVKVSADLTPTPSPTVTVTATPSPTVTGTPSVSPTVSPAVTPSPTTSPVPTETSTPTPTATNTPTPEPEDPTHITNFKGRNKSGGKVRLEWDAVEGAQYYKIFMSTGGLYTEMKQTANDFALIKDMEPGTRAHFLVKAYKNGNVIRTSPLLLVFINPDVPDAKTASYPKKKTYVVSWKRVECDGYDVFVDDEITYDRAYDSLTYNIDDFEYIGTAEGADTLSLTVKDDDPMKPKAVCVRAYCWDGDFKCYSSSSKIMVSNSAESVFNALKKGKSKKYVTVEKSFSSTSTYSKTYMTDNDLKILKKFAKKHFTSDMSDFEKVKVTYDYLTTHVAYDKPYGMGGTYVSRAFKEHIGQCDSYSGAMGMMLAYLGYDSYLVRGFVGNHSGHYWLEIRAGGNKYVIDPNSEFYVDPDYPSRYYFCARYIDPFFKTWYNSKLDKYECRFIKNGKRVSY